MSDAEPAPARLSPWAALQHRDFRLLWMGQMISLAGTQMQLVTIHWHISSLTNSALALGLVGLVRVLPIVVFSLLGGAFADSHDRRRVLLFTQSAMFGLAAVLALVTVSGRITAGLILLLAALTSSAAAFDGPARQALIPNLVPNEHLTNALSLNFLMAQVASIVGPGLAGFVIAGLGIAAVYWFNAVSFLAVLVALAFMHSPPQQKRIATRITLSAIGDGIRFVKETRIILATMLLDFLATFFSSATTLLPIFARDILRVGPEGLGVLYAGESAGAALAGAGMSIAGRVRRQGPVLLIAVALYGLATALYGASQWFVLSFVLLACIGAADTVSTVLRNTIRQLSTPDHLRGRMTSVNMIFFMGGPQLGDLEAGVVAAALGAPLAVISGGIATLLLVGLTAWLVPQLRQYREAGVA